MNKNNLQFLFNKPWLNLITFVVYWLVSTHVHAQVCSQVSYVSPHNPSNQISFVFNKAYPCGQYANGDWWVSPEVAGEKVTIVSILPEAKTGRNGFVVNPDTKTKQVYDARVMDYEAGLQPLLPLEIGQDSSIVKAISLPEDSKKKCRPCLKYAAVLTVTAVPVADSQLLFRPGYFGHKKTSFKVDIAKWQSLLSPHQVAFKIGGIASPEQMASRYQPLQFDAVEDYGADALHPLDNLPHYGASIAKDNAIFALRFLLDDFNLNQKSYAQALINYLQMSIDYLSMADNGFKWSENGGHSNGRKLPLVLGALLIDDAAFSEAIKKSVFSEDQQMYLSKVTHQVLYGAECSEELYWKSVIHKKGDRTCRDPYEQVDGGGAEIGQAYQWCCTAKPWKYTSLVLMLLNEQERWGNPHFFTYVKRWVESGVIASPDNCAPYNGVPSDKGLVYGSDQNGGCIAGSGRWQNMHGKNADTGGYFDDFGDRFWRWFMQEKSTGSAAPQ